VTEAWYAIYTRYQHEKSAANLLERKEFTVFLPLYSAARSWGDRKQTVVLPLFPCYLFVQMSLERKLEVLRTAGVQWLVESAGRACEVPETDVQSLRKVCSVGVRLKPHAYLKQGERVRIHGGPLAGTEGFFVRAKNECRVVVSIGLLRKGVSVEVDALDVEGLESTGENALASEALAHSSA
jgi:transcription antitermination factor NusG